MRLAGHTNRRVELTTSAPVLDGPHRVPLAPLIRRALARQTTCGGLVTLSRFCLQLPQWATTGNAIRY